MLVADNDDDDDVDHFVDILLVADEVICGITPDEFGAVGMWYEDFSQTTDEEVCAILATSFTEAHS